MTSHHRQAIFAVADQVGCLAYLDGEGVLPELRRLQVDKRYTAAGDRSFGFSLKSERRCARVFWPRR